MAKNSVDAYGASGKTNLLTFDPDVLHLVTDEAHPLFDARVHLPLRESMVRNVMAYGVRQPVSIVKDPETGLVCVVAGRQRVKHAREANKRLRERGEEPIMVPAWAQRDAVESLADVSALENAQREDETPLGRADKMRRLMARGRTEEQLGIIFGCTVATVRSTLSMLDCTADVRNAIEAGKITVTHAAKLAKMAPAEQRTKVAELVAAGDGLRGHARARQQRAVIAPGATKMRTRKAIAAERDAATGERRAVLSWVLGEAGGSLNDALMLSEIQSKLAGSN